MDEDKVHIGVVDRALAKMLKKGVEKETAASERRESPAHEMMESKAYEKKEHKIIKDMKGKSRETEYCTHCKKDTYSHIKGGKEWPVYCSTCGLPRR